MASESKRRIPLDETPRIEHLLGALRWRLSALIVFYGVGTVVGVVAGWLVFAYLADWGLRVPKTVRILHGLVLAGLVVAFVWRDLIRPMRRIPGSPGLALLFERAHPDLRELLVSAVQFQAPDRAGADNPILIRRVLADAEERARALSAKGILDERTSRSRFLLGGGAALAVILFAFANPVQATIFLDRLVGGSMPWPQRTHLSIDIPSIDAIARIEDTEEVLSLRIARGTDIPIVVRASGIVPDEVRLHFEGGRDLLLSRSGTNVFRTLLRSCQEDIAFFATGGDDEDGRPRVEVEVLQPPDVEGIAIAIRPPDYTGLPAEVVFDRDVDVLAGSKLRIHVLPFPAEANGSARLSPNDVTVPLAAAPFPNRPTPNAEPTDGTEPNGADQPAGLYFDHVASSSIGFRVELEDASGLTNPDPGLFRVQVHEDRAPVIDVLAPSRSDFEIVLGGAIPLRARVSDDFGLGRVSWSVEITSLADERVEVASGTFALQPVPDADGNEERRVRLAATRLEVDELATPAIPIAIDQRYVFQLVAIDNRQPEPNVGRSLPIRARVVTPEELLRRMQERLARARLDALNLSNLQTEKRQRVEDLIDALDGDGAADAGETVALAAALSGQRRVLGDAQALGRDLASVAEDILYARLDDKAGALLDHYDALSATNSELRFRQEPWRELAARASDGQLGASGFAVNLVQLVGLALEISEDHVRAAATALDEAERALDTGPRVEALVRASELQSASLARIDDLLDELAEWDNFQNVLSLTRDILNRQKALRERTQKYATER